MKQAYPHLPASQASKSMLLLALLLGIWLQVSAQNITYYHAITGSYSNEQSAAVQLTVLEKQGLRGVLIFPSKVGEVYRVSAFQSMNKLEVENYVASLKKKGYTQSWVFSQSGPSKVLTPPAPGATAKVPTKPATTTTPQGAPAPSTPYQPSVLAGKVNYLIVAKAKNQPDAQLTANKLASDGFRSYVLEPMKKGDPYRIAIMRQEDRKVVEAYKTTVKTRFKDAWILTISELPGTGSTTQPTVNSRGMASASAGTNPTARVASPAAATGSASMYPQNKTTYHLVVASVKEWQKANDVLQAWKLQGYSATILPAGAGISDTFRVSVYSSSSKEDVDSYLGRLKEAGVKESMWVTVYP